MSRSDQQPVRKAHRLPAEAYASTAHAYFLTVCARHHGEPFRAKPLADAIVRSLLWTRDRYRWHLFAYCLMPDHLHFVCRLTDTMGVANTGRRGILPAGVLDQIARFKSFTSREGWKHGFKASCGNGAAMTPCWTAHDLSRMWGGTSSTIRYGKAW